MNGIRQRQGCWSYAVRTALFAVGVFTILGFRPDTRAPAIEAAAIPEAVTAPIKPWSGPRDVLRAVSERHIQRGHPHPATQAELMPMSGISVGTAWPIAEGYAVTNNHIIADTKVITLFDAGDDKVEEFIAFVVARDEDHDIAILKVKNPDDLPPALPVSAGPARMGTPVFTIGYPRIDLMGTTPKLSAGLISAVTGLRDDPNTYQISAPIEPGNSGGPLLNMKGEVVGMVATMLYAKDFSSGSEYRVPNVSYALKVDAVRKLIETLPERNRKLKEINRDAGSLEELAERVERSVMIVMAW